MEIALDGGRDSEVVLFLLSDLLLKTKKRKWPSSNVSLQEEIPLTGGGMAVEDFIDTQGE
jgi:hypothetical protein